MQLQQAHSVSRVNMSVQHLINTDVHKCCITVDTTRLTAEAWHHFLKINHDIIAELTQPLSLGHSAGPSLPPSWSCDICALGSCFCIQSEGRLASFLISYLLEDPASIPFPLSFCCAHADADGSTNNPPSLPPFSLMSLPPFPPHSPETVNSI